MTLTFSAGLGSWEARFNNPKARGKIFSSPNGPWKAALLSGSPGIGKTTMATLVAKEAGRDLLEFNASDVRSKKALGQGLGDVTGSRVLFDTSDGSGKKGSMKKRCIIMDEVDGMGAGDRSGMAELIKMIKTSQVPIICICNDRQSQKIRSLVQYCMDLRCRRPIKSVIARRAVQIGKEEGLFVEQNAAEAIVESCGNDIRQVLNVMQMWANKKGAGSSMTYKDLKEREHSINKDEILRVSMFDATKMIIEGRKGLTGTDPKAERASIMKRSDAFFVDYSLMGLNVQQNYLKVLNGRYGEAKRSGDERKVESFLVEMHKAADAMSDFAVAENAVRSGDQNWALLPLCAMLAVKTGYHASGENGAFFPGFPEFPAWMGKNSTRGKKNRLLAELGHHMNYHIGGDSTELRMCYIPVLRERFLSLLTSKDGAHTAEAIALMDEYGLDRDDVFENLDEFKLNPKAEKLGSVLDSKQKAAFTREYNQGKHKSQALVAEQGLVKTKKAKSNGGSNAGDLVDPDAINDDVVEVSGDENEKDDLEEAKIREKFLKKKGKSTAAKKKKASTGDKGKKKK
jgi:replication factor C subunit 1